MQFEPHYSEIRTADQVQIYESILGDPAGRVTTGLVAATAYLKDNRLLPRGFNKESAPAEIAVHGSALADAGFNDHGHAIRYTVDVGAEPGPFEAVVELWYQPIGYRWAKNLSAYDSDETHRFVDYYDSMGRGSAILLTKTQSLSR